MVGVTQKIKRVISFLLVFLMVINSTTAFADSEQTTNAGSELTGQLRKSNQTLTTNDSVSINDILTWRITIDKNELDNGIAIELPEGVLPDITSETLEGLTATVNGNTVTVTSKTDSVSNIEKYTTATGPAIVTSDTQTLDVPCKIDQTRVNDGKISIAGISLNVNDIVQTGNTVAPDTITLLQKKNSVETAITTGAKVSLYDSFILRMTWNSLENVKAGYTYQMELPEEFGIPAADGSTMIKAQDVPLDFPDLPFAKISWKAGDKNLQIEFLDMGKYTVDGVEYDALSLLGNASIDYECKLYEDLTANEQGQITIDLLNDSVTITVNELVPKAPQLNKTVGTWNEQGEVEWTVTYTHPVSSYTGDIPTKLIDTIPSGMVYVDNSSNAKVNGVDKTSWISKVDNNLICDLSDIKGGQILTFTYKTKLTEEELTSIWNSGVDKSYTNKIVAKVVDTDAKGVQGNRTATISSNSWSGKTVIAKDGIAVAPTDINDDWKINWEVTVQTGSRNFKNLVLTDVMGEGLILDQSSVKVVNENGDTSSPAIAFSTTADGKTTMEVTLVSNGNPVTSEKTYKITYTTTVKKEYFDQTSTLTDDSIKNKATLTYEWPDGIGTGGIFTPPSVSKKPTNINNRLLEKSGGIYNRVEHSLPWEIKVNPNKVNLTKVELVDDLSAMDPKHNFVPDGSTEESVVTGIKKTIEDAVKKGLETAGISEAVQDSVVVDLVGNKLTIKMDNLGKNSFSFKVKTYAIDPSFYGGNDAKTFNNTVTMTMAGTTVDSVPISADVSAKASINASSIVLAKKHVSYDATGKKITWSLTVNENETNLGDVTISDTLEDGLSCNVNEATLNGGSFTGDNKFTFDDTTNTINIKLSKVTGKVDITYTTTLDVDREVFQTKDKVDINNTATMTSETNTKEVTSNKTLALTNKALTKTAALNNQDLTADYTVKLNPLGMDLLKGLPSTQKLQLEDTLPDGLYLDLDSVKLYKAGALNVNQSSDTYTVEMAPETTAIETTTAYDPTTRTLTVDIPDATQGYILKYRTYIVRTGVDLTNNIRLVGSVLPETSSLKNTQNKVNVASSGNARMVLPKASFVSLQIKKVDENGNKLNGAVFGLFANKTDATPLVSATCDSVTGICTLAISKSLVKNYQTLYWKEIIAPTGYEVNSRWNELDINNYDPDTVINVVNVPNGDAVSAQIKLRKTDATDASKVLAGAVFGLYEDKDCKTPVIENNKEVTSTSDSNGIVTFTKLYPEQSYYVREVSAPIGYVRSDQVTTVIAKRTWADSNAISVTNEKANVTLTVVKVDALDSTKKLINAEFQLYEDENCTVKMGVLQSTDNNGTTSFTGLYPNKTYYLKEITAPQGYILNSDIFAITTGNNGEVISKQIGNYSIGWDEKASVQITKTNENGSKFLSGASFALYGNDKTTLLGEKSTDNAGVCSFTQLKKGTYYIKETVAPKGYVLSKDWIEVSVGVNEAVTLTVTNKEIPPVVPTNPPIGPSNPGESTDPSDPSDPEEPEDPVKPEDPDKPEKPDKDDEEKPTKPDKDNGQNPNKPNKPDTNNEKSTDANSKDTSNSNDKGANNRNSSADTNQKNKDTQTNGALPKTGVTTHFALWLTGIAISLLAAFGLVVSWKHQSKRKNS